MILFKPLYPYIKVTGYMSEAIDLINRSTDKVLIYTKAFINFLKTTKNIYFNNKLVINNLKGRVNFDVHTIIAN